MTNILLLLFLFLVTPAHALVGVAQSAAPTSNGGTQDLTVSGLGTAVCGLFWTTYGTANGTGVDHAMFAVGFSDFTTGQSVSSSDEDNQATTDTGASSGATALRTQLATDQSVDGTASASAITNGIRLTWSDAPPSAYLVNSLIFGDGAVDDCHVGTLTASSTEDATASTTAPGFQPNLVFAITENTTGDMRNSFGFAVDDGGVVQRSSGMSSNDASANADVAQTTSDSYFALNPINPTAAGAWELTSFDTTGFTVTTRLTATGSTIRYMAVKLKTGQLPKIVNCSSPTATGSHSCTGAGWAPQALMMIHSESAAYDTTYTAGNNEVLGISACDASNCYSGAVTANDGAGTSDTKSITANVPVRLIKDGSDWMTASSTGPQSDGWDFSYSVAPGSAYVRGVLMIQAAAASGGNLMIRRRLQ